jgi:betaine lipid synthase
MDFLGGNIVPLIPELIIFLGIGVVLLAGISFSTFITKKVGDNENPNCIQSLWLFFYSCFLKPNNGDSKGNQQGALESFYKTQASAYDATRKVLLKGREDMLALAAAQLIFKAKQAKSNDTKRIWVDVCNRNRLLPIRSLIQIIGWWWYRMEH